MFDGELRRRVISIIRGGSWRRMVTAQDIHSKYNEDDENHCTNNGECNEEWVQVEIS